VTKIAVTLLIPSPTTVGQWLGLAEGHSYSCEGETIHPEWIGPARERCGEYEMARLIHRRWLLAAAVVGIGLVTVTVGAWLETRNPRSNLEDDLAWCLLAAGMCLIGAGVSLPFARPIIVILSAIAAPVAGWCLLFLAYWMSMFFSGWPSQEQMVPSGYAMIPEAKQIDDLLGPARHEVCNYREPDIVEWQTHALFAGRYELVMIASVRVDRRSGRITEVIEAPRFQLLEIETTDGTRTTFRQASQREFRVDQWRRVVKACGDFSVIGIHLNSDSPVPGFERYRSQAPNGIRMRADGDRPLAPGR
jgi:hypothetical protein